MRPVKQTLVVCLPESSTFVQCACVKDDGRAWRIMQLDIEIVLSRGLRSLAFFCRDVRARLYRESQLILSVILQIATVVMLWLSFLSVGCQNGFCAGTPIMQSLDLSLSALDSCAHSHLIISISLLYSAWPA